MSANMQDGGDPTAACRTCTDFRTWAKLTKQAFDANKKEGKQDSNSKQGDSNNGGLMTVSTSERLHKQCPLDRDELGRNTWSLLHTIAAYYPRMPTASQKQDMKNFFNILGRIYPCDHCAADLRNDLVESPPVLENPNGFAQWLCRLHNKVNVKLEKPVFDCSRVNERWRDGWRDGSCDS